MKTKRKKKDNKFDITYENINMFSRKFNKTKKNKVFKNMNTKGNFKNIVLKSEYIQNKKIFFKNKIDVETLPTDQEKSGRCWIFAFLNIIRIDMIKKYNLTNFELSQTYLFFYDKLERANNFLNYAIKNIKVSLNNDKLNYIMDNITHDGGTFNIVANLIEKYGIVPKNNMDDLFHSKNSDDLNTFFSNFLKKSFYKIKHEKKRDLYKLKNEILSDCYKILVIFLGEPPKKITWEYYTEDKTTNKKTYNVVENITPNEFYEKYICYKLKDKISLINYTCKPYYKKYKSELIDVYGKKDNLYINVPIEEIINGIKLSIDNKEAVWIGIDTNMYKSKEEGIYDRNAFNYKDIFGFHNDMNKCDSLLYGRTDINHAVIVKGYNLYEQNKNMNGFLIEDSHGKNNGFNGDYYMNIDWFKEYGYMAVLDKKYISEKVLSVLNQKTIITLPYYDVI